MSDRLEELRAAYDAAIDAADAASGLAPAAARPPPDLRSRHVIQPPSHPSDPVDATVEPPPGPGPGGVPGSRGGSMGTVLAWICILTLVGVMVVLRGGGSGAGADPTGPISSDDAAADAEQRWREAKADLEAGGAG